MKKPLTQMIDNFKAYYQLTKPGIIYGNLLTVIGAFFYGAAKNIDFISLLGIVIGASFTIACGCVINNYLDRTIDLKMKRTSKRALATGIISGKTALVFAGCLGIIGVASLAVYTNQLTTAIGIAGLVLYATVYTYLKRLTIHGTLIGAIPGAIPPLAGYTAATNRIDLDAIILVFILVFWQMVHFYAIATFRLSDYRSAKIPLMPIVYGMKATKIQMIVYCALFIAAIVALVQLGNAGLTFLIIMASLSLWWFNSVTAGLFSSDDEVWARSVFKRSLFMLPAFSICLVINPWVI